MGSGNVVAFWQKQYELSGNNIGRWADVAYGLVAAADVLKTFHGGVYDELMRRTESGTLTETEFQRMCVAAPAAMLRAMAIECYLKALWLKGGNALVVGGAYKKILKKNEHQFDQLAAAVAATGVITFSTDELALLKFVSFWNSAGRYPIPVHYSRLSALDTDENGGTMPRSDWIADPEKRVADLVRRLQQELGAQYDFATDAST